MKVRIQPVRTGRHADRYAPRMNHQDPREDRFIDLETRLAYQDETLRVLSDTVARQQKQIDQLGTLCRQLLERVKAQATEGFKNTLADEVPPHY